jgi:hypothetical protein
VRGPLGWSPAAAAGGLCAAGGEEGDVLCQYRHVQRCVRVCVCVCVCVLYRQQSCFGVKQELPPSAPLSLYSHVMAPPARSPLFNQSQFLVLFLAPRLGRRALRHELGKAVPGDREIRREMVVIHAAVCRSCRTLPPLCWRQRQRPRPGLLSAPAPRPPATNSHTSNERRRLTQVFGARHDTRCEMVQGACTAIARARVAERSRSAVSIS